MTRQLARGIATTVALLAAGCSDEPGSDQSSTTTSAPAFTTLEKGQGAAATVLEEAIQGSPPDSTSWQVLVELEPPFGIVTTNRTRIGFSAVEFACEGTSATPTALRPGDRLTFVRTDGEIAASDPPQIGARSIVAQCSG